VNQHTMLVANKNYHMIISTFMWTKG
jgi:hypothetical protein